MLRRLARRARGILLRSRLEREMAEEMRQHVALEAAERERAGAPATEARRSALRDFGGPERWLEEARAARGWGRLDEARQDVRYAVRTLAGAPAFTLAAVLTLGLGIGANSAVFSVVDGVLLKPLAYPEPDRIVRLFDYRETEIGSGWGTISYANFADMRERARLWEAAAGYDEWQVSLMVDGAAERYDGAIVDAAWFDVLGVEPALGRFFGAEEATPGGPSRVVLSWGLWQERFGGDRSIIGRSIETNGYASEVIGVAPAALQDPGLSGGSFGAPRLWRSPAAYFTSNSRGSRSFAALIRLRPGVTVEQAQHETDALQRQLVAAHAENNAGYVARLVPLAQTLVGRVRRDLLILLGAVGLVLVIACANVGNLLVVRGTARARELSVRVALGASRRRLLRQLLVESMVLAGAGAVLGIALAWGGTAVLRTYLAEHLPRANDVVVDGRVLGFTLLLALLTAVVFGLLPALQASRSGVSAAMRAGDRSVTGSRRQSRIRAAVVAAEVALALVVLIGAGLLGRSLLRLQSVDTGIGAQSEAVTLQLLTAPEYEGEALAAYYVRLFDAIGAVPGVRAVGAVDLLPMSGSFNSAPFGIAGRDVADPQERPEAELRAVTGALFAALGVPLLRGRAPGAEDRADAPPVVVIDQALAQRYFGDEDPIGQRLATYDHERTIVGVVGSVTQFTLDQAATPTIYFPGAQAPEWMQDDATLIVRVAGDAGAAIPALRAAVRAVDPRTAIARVRTVQRVIDDTLVLPRFRTLLLLMFAAIAFTLAVIGIYGTVAYAVTRRTREFGIRSALGAGRAQIVRHVLGIGLRPVLAGAAAGIPLALLGSRLLQSLLFEVSPLDARTFLLVPVALVLVAVVAAGIPAHRAAGAGPLRSLRED